MSHQEPSPPPARPGSVAPSSNDTPLCDVGRRLHGGMLTIAVLGAAGLVLGLIAAGWAQRNTSPHSELHVVLSFPGFERGQYPDGSLFQPDDLRRYPIVTEAITRTTGAATPEQIASVRKGLTIEGIIPEAVVAQRDQVRADGQRPPPYIPDAYRLTLTSKDSPWDGSQREQLLRDLVAVYHEQFRETYAEIPRSFGRIFAALEEADYTEYELLINTEIDNIRAYLEQMSAQAGAFRSPTTNQSFNDLIERTEFFSQIQLNQTLGIIHQFGLSRDRDLAMSKMDYHLQLLAFREQQAIEEESVIRDLLAQTQGRNQSYVLSVRAEAAEGRDEAPIIDRGLINSLVESDAYNFLIREALNAGLRTKEIQAEKARLLDLRENMQSFRESDIRDRSDAVAEAERSLGSLRTAYDALIKSIRDTYRDFAEERFGQAVRTSTVGSSSSVPPLAIAGAGGGMLGLALGAGLSLMGAGPRRASRKG